MERARFPNAPWRNALCLIKVTYDEVLKAGGGGGTRMLMVHVYLSVCVGADVGIDVGDGIRAGVGSMHKSFCFGGTCAGHNQCLF